MRKKSKMSNDNRSVSRTSDVNQTHTPSKDVHYSYEVFLSFRGVDTRNAFTGHLYGALDQMGVNTFIDSEELHKGETLNTLMESIKKSRIAIIVFSENYATSYWCLKEVTQIMKCEEAKVIQKVLPVFYNVEPRDVRNQTAGSSYARAFAGHRNESEDQIKEWKDNLKKAGALSGYTLDGHTEYLLIQDIVKEVLFLLNRKPFHVPANLVGMHTHLEKMKKILDLKENDVRHMVGIWETGGSGKTTIAKFIYNEIANQFSCHGFLANVRETCQKSGLLQLQKTLLSQTMRDKYSNIVDVDQGIRMIKDKLGNKKTLLVIDDVDNLEQLEKLAGSLEWFGVGSRIIITTRNIEILKSHKVNNVYRVPPLEPKDVKELFTRILFQDDKDKKDYENLLTELVGCRKLFPLAVRVLASSLRGKDKLVWQDTLKKLDKIVDREIFETLNVSYENLHENEQQMFLDIACFFTGRQLEYVRGALESCGFHPDSGIGELISRSLIYIKDDKIDMHREIQELGREIVRRESRQDPSKRSRLWIKDEILEVLSRNTVKENIEGIKLELEGPGKISLSSEALAQMERLRLFIADNITCGTPNKFSSGLKWLDWPGYSLQSLPLSDENKKITGLHMSGSKIKLSERELQPFSKLKFINFSHSTLLRKIPDLSSVTDLQSLNVEECTNLTEVHQSLGSLKKLVHLNFSNCRQLHTFAFSLNSNSLRDLILKGCSNLSKFPEILVEMEYVTRLCLNETAIDELPPSIEKLINLRELHLENCKNLTCLPSSIYKLEALQRICLGGCSALEKFPECMDNSNSSSEVSEPLAFPELIYLGLQGCGLTEIKFIKNLSRHSKLKILDLSGSNIVGIPERISNFSLLEQLCLTNCKQLQLIEDLPPDIRYVSAKGCESLEHCEPLSNILKTVTEASPCIKRIDFAGCDKLTQHLCTMADMLSPEDLFGDSRIEILHPGTEIPKWFDHASVEGSVTFSIISEWHQIAGLAFIGSIGFDEQNTSVSCEVQVYVNSQRAYASVNSFPSMDTNHMFFLYVPRGMMWGWDAKMQEGRNQLKVEFEVSRGTLRSCAVHLVLDKDRAQNESINSLNPERLIDRPETSSKRRGTKRKQRTR